MNLLIVYFFVLLLLIYALNKKKIKTLLARNQNFKCNNCGECCRFKVELSEKDIQRIKTNVDYVVEEKNKKYIKRINYYCVFLRIVKGKSECSIYDMRPDICREFPYGKVYGVKCYDLRCPEIKMLKFMKYF